MSFDQTKQYGKLDPLKPDATTDEIGQVQAEQKAWFRDVMGDKAKELQPLLTFDFVPDEYGNIQSLCRFPGVPA
jgi:hypothetical protein